MFGGVSSKGVSYVDFSFICVQWGLIEGCLHLEPMMCLIWDLLAVIEDLKMRLSWIRVNPKSNDRYPTKRKEKEKAHREDEVKTEAESRVVNLQAKESHRLPAATSSQEKARNEFSPRTNLDSIP